MCASESGPPPPPLGGPPPRDGGDDLQRAQEGDLGAYQRLVEAHSDKVFRLCRRITGNPADAEDAVQETFLKVYRNLASFEARARFSTWLYRVAANCAVDQVRRRQRHDRHRSVSPTGALGSEPADGFGEAQVAEPESPAPDPERLLSSRQVGLDLKSALEACSAQERAAFVLRHFEGCTTAEIGAALGLKTNATKQAVFRAVRKVRHSLQGWVEAPEGSS